MIATFKNAFKVKDLRVKIFFTILIIIIFRIGSAIPVPFLDTSVLQGMTGGADATFFDYLNVLTGGGFASATLFAMSITPYINASIIIQLLTVAIPALERLSKEGMEGRKKLNKITKYFTVILGFIQAVAYFLLLKSQGAVISDYTSGFVGIWTALVIIITFTAGTALVMWLGEEINAKGIGNGISIILFAGIISRAPQAVTLLYNYLKTGETKYYFLVPIVVVIFLLMIMFIVIMTNAERKIPVQYAKRVVGRKMYGGQSSHIPVKVNMSGVMPIIFASSLISIPTTIAAFFPPTEGTFWENFLLWFRYDNWPYAIIYFFLIIAFNYFYVSIQYNPIEISNNLRKNNGGIPGLRPGKPTSDFIGKIIGKITLIGAIFLAIIAIFPILFGQFSGMNIALGGTSILIIVGVALETGRQLESQMMMRHHKGFLE
ncbi:MAG: preprotein translocase subunit SecY [Oscillospiraceae bacterium]|nr:preprotein translocase subunit SecY [Oscillospiraceae bacterium]